MAQDELDAALARRTRQVLARQIGIGIVAAAVFYWFKGVWGAESALYGVAVNLFMTLLLGRGVTRAGHAAAADARRGMLILLIGVVQRFVLVLVLFGVGFAWLKLDPLAAVVGFALAQLGYLVSVREHSEVSK